MIHDDDDDDNDEEGAPDPANKFRKGDYMEVLDTVQKWETARVIKVNGLRIKIHYDAWSPKFIKKKYFFCCCVMFFI